jgi:hypothetical protein
MAYETDKVLRNRVKYFSGFATKTVVDYLVYNQTYSQGQKIKILEIAKEIARNKGYHRVTWEDFAEAINKFRSGLNVGKENNLQKKM